MAGVVGPWSAIVVLALGEGRGAVAPSPALASLAIVVTVIACAVCVLRWRLFGNPAYLLAGLGISVLEIVKSGAAHTGVWPAVLAVGFLCGVGLVAASARAWRTQAEQRLSNEGRAGIVVLALLVFAVMTTMPDQARIIAGDLPRVHSVSDAAGHLAVAGGLLWLAGLHRSGGRIDGFHGWIAGVLAFRAHARLALALSATGNGAWIVGAQVFMAASAVLLMCAALAALRRDMARQQRDLAAATDALAEAVTLQQRLVGDLAKRRHDVNSAVFCIGGTSMLLDEGWADLEPDERRLLLRGLRDEADRMRLLVTPDSQDSARLDAGAARLHDVVPAVVLSARAHGRDVRLAPLGDAAVVMPPAELAAVLRALLDDAHQRAPYSPVDVVVQVGDEAVRLAVSDHGGSMPGPLDAIRQTVEQHSGAVTVDETPGGGGSVVVVLRRVHAKVRGEVA